MVYIMLEKTQMHTHPSDKSPLQMHKAIYKCRVSSLMVKSAAEYKKDKKELFKNFLTEYIVPFHLNKMKYISFTFFNNACHWINIFFLTQYTLFYTYENKLKYIPFTLFHISDFERHNEAESLSFKDIRNCSFVL